jgi:hypothetical protein
MRRWRNRKTAQIEKAAKANAKTRRADAHGRLE